MDWIGMQTTAMHSNRATESLTWDVQKFSDMSPADPHKPELLSFEFSTSK